MNSYVIEYVYRFNPKKDDSVKCKTEIYKTKEDAIEYINKVLLNVLNIDKSTIKIIPIE